MLMLRLRLNLWRSNENVRGGLAVGIGIVATTLCARIGYQGVGDDDKGGVCSDLVGWDLGVCEKMAGGEAGMRDEAMGLLRLVAQRKS